LTDGSSIPWATTPNDV